MVYNQLFDLQKMIQKSIQSQIESTEVESMIVEKPPLSNSARISVYQKAYIIRMTESLSEDFEILKSQISEIKFNALIQNYIQNQPSDVRNLAEYSLNFPQFILQKNPEYYEFAIMDWLILRSNQALEDENSVSMEQVQNGLSFDLYRHPACILQATQTDFLMAYRLRDEATLCSITQSEFSILNFLESQQSMKNIQDFTESIKITEARLQSLISEWIAKKIIILKRSI